MKPGSILRVVWRYYTPYLICRHKSSMCVFPVLIALKNHLWVILGCDVYAPAYFFLKYKACLKFKTPVSLSTEELFGPGCQKSLDFFAEALNFMHNSIWLQNLSLIALVILSPSVSCSLLISKNVLWEGSEHHVGRTKVCRGHSTLFLPQLTCSIKQHPTPPLLPTVILSVLKSTWFWLLL